MSSFLKTASKSVGDVRNFLRDSAGGNSIKYAGEKGAKHVIYIPYTSEVVMDDQTQTEVAKKSIISIQGNIHEWTTQDGKFKAICCLKDIIRKSDEDPNIVLNDGTCPFCDRISDAWDIYRYRKELEEANCKLTGEQRKTHLDKTFRIYTDERKAKDAKPYMYLLVVKYRLNEAGKEVIGSDGVPEYDLKVMKLSASRVEKIQQQIANSGAELPGSELIFEYPNVEDRRLLISQSTTAPVFPTNMMTTKYPALIDKINQDVAKFQWEGIEKAFPEWAGMTTMEAKSTTDGMFSMWDKYKAEIMVNPAAKYLEYVMETPTSVPNINGAGLGDAAGQGAIPVIPQIPTIPSAEAPVMPGQAGAAATIPVVPSAPVAPAPAQTPQASIPIVPTPPAANPNEVFGNAGPAAPTLTV